MIWLLLPGRERAKQKPVGRPAWGDDEKPTHPRHGKLSVLAGAQQSLANTQ